MKLYLFRIVNPKLTNPKYRANRREGEGPRLTELNLSSQWEERGGGAKSRRVKSKRPMGEERGRGLG
jgi:hypothetical protein